MLFLNDYIVVPPEFSCKVKLILILFVFMSLAVYVCRQQSNMVVLRNVYRKAILTIFTATMKH